MVFDQNKLQKLINFYKTALVTQYGDIFILNDLLKKSFKNLNEFYNEVEGRMYKIDFRKISEEYVHGCVNQGKLYLFEIYNKDFSQENKKPGKENLHTTYFKMLFDERNLKSPILKLSGGGEIFFRPKTDNLPTRKDNNGKQVVVNKRYAEDKIFFHCPIVLNAQAEENKKINQKVNKLIVGESAINIIGIDRGEKYLAYFSVALLHE